MSNHSSQPVATLDDNPKKRKEQNTALEVVNQALRESEARFRALVEASSDAVYHMSPDWAEMRQLVGRDFIPDTLASNYKWLEKYILPEDQEHVIAVINQAIRTKSIFELEHRVVRADGSVGWTSSRAIPMLNEEGEIKEWFGMARDITESKQVEEALRESEERFRGLFENMSSGVAIYEAVDNGRDFVFKGFNAAGERVDQIPRNDAIGRRVTEVFPGVEAFGLLDVFRRVWKTGTAEHHPVAQYNDGRISGWRENYIYRLPTGEIVAIYDDVTERKQAEEALREDEERLKLAQAAAGAGLWDWDIPNGKLNWSGELFRLFGLDPQKAGASFDLWKGALHPEDRKIAEDQIINATSKETPLDSEYRIVLPSGEIRWIKALGRTICDENNQPIRMLGICLDITGRKRDQEELEQELTAMSRLQKVAGLFATQGDLQPLLCEVIDAAIAIANADFGTVQLLNQTTGHLQIKAQRGFPEWWVDFWKTAGIGKGSCGAALKRSERVIIEDVTLSPVFLGSPALEIQLKAGVRAVQSTPLISRSGKLVGMFSTHYKTPQRPNDRALRLLDLLARQTADLIEHIEDQTALRRNERELTDFFNNSPVGLFWIDSDGKILRINAAALEFLGYDEAAILGQPSEKFHVDPDNAIALIQRLANGETIHNYHTCLRQKNGHILHVLIDANGIWQQRQLVHSCWFVRDITRRVELEREVLTASDQERQRLGQDLHDDLCQQLTGISFLSASLAREITEKRGDPASDARQIAQLARKAAKQAREIARGLLPIRSEADGLAEGLKALAEHTSTVFRRQCQFHCTASVLIPDTAVALHLYRIAQEAVHNAIKHGKAKHIDIQLAATGKKVILAVRNDGLGISKKSASHKGLGLRIMQYRIGLIGGSLLVQRQADGGTEIVCTVEDGLRAPQSRMST